LEKKNNFSNMEKQKNVIESKFTNIANDQNERIIKLQNNIEENKKIAEVIELNKDLVNSCLNIINEILRQKFQWD
jgi:hypothetical protein